MSTYFQNIKDAFSTLAGGLKLTFRYLAEARTSRKPIGVMDENYFEVEKGIVTLQYPYESLPVPDNGRYRLHNEIDDCIVCDKCAKVCPVDCIEIDAIKAVETFGVTSDGTPKRIHAAKFDIDMSKCCFCGLCTTVCPTECLTMTKVYDFSEFDVNDHVYSFANMSLAEIAEKRKAMEDAEAQKAAKAPAKVVNPIAESSVSEEAKPAFKPKVMMKPKSVAKPQVEESAAATDKSENKPRPVFKPKPVQKPKTEVGEPTKEANKEELKESTESAETVSRPKPVMKARPVMKPKSDEQEAEEKPVQPKPVMKMKPVIKKTEDKPEELESKTQRPKPVIKPKLEAQPEPSTDNTEESVEKPKFRPKPMIPKKKKDDGAE